MSRIRDLFDANCMQLNLEAEKKRALLDELTALLATAGHVADPVRLVDELEARERDSSTGIGWGVAIPHKLSDTARRTVIAFGRSGKGIPFHAIDHKPVHLVFLIVAPATATRGLLKILSKLSRLLHGREFRDNLMRADSPAQVLALFDEQEND